MVFLNLVKLFSQQIRNFRDQISLWFDAWNKYLIKHSKKIQIDVSCFQWNIFLKIKNVGFFYLRLKSVRNESITKKRYMFDKRNFKEIIKWIGQISKIVPSFRFELSPVKIKLIKFYCILKGEQLSNCTHYGILNVN